MKRITVDEVRAAYEKTGLKPAVNDLLDSEFNHYQPTRGCGLGALYVADGGLAYMNATVSVVAKDLGLGKAYAYGFSDGFDGVAGGGLHLWGLAGLDGGDADYSLGYGDGKAAGDAMLSRS
jgi:hypothetical protein